MSISSFWELGRNIFLIIIPHLYFLFCGMLTCEYAIQIRCEGFPIAIHCQAWATNTCSWPHTAKNLHGSRVMKREIHRGGQKTNSWFQACNSLKAKVASLCLCTPERLGKKMQSIGKGLNQHSLGNRVNDQENESKKLSRWDFLEQFHADKWLFNFPKHTSEGGMY